MSWPERLFPAIALAAAIALAGCGFRPMYGKSSADPAVTRELASILVEQPIPNRNGQLLHNALLTQLNPLGEPVRPAYFLKINLSSTDTAEATMPDDTATRNLVTYTVTYSLYRSDNILTQGTSITKISYDYLKQHFSDISAQKSVESRAADQVALDVRNQLAAYFIRAAKVHRGEIPAVR